MSGEILLLNGRRRKKTTRKRATKKRTAKKRTAKKTATKRTRRNPARVAAARGVRTMAKRKPAKRKAAPRRNPSSRRSPARRRATQRARGAFSGLNFKSALKNIPLSVLGMFIAKWTAKRFGQSATETDPTTWNYASYLKGAAGCAVGGLLANMMKPGTGQKLLEGGMGLMLYKLIQNEGIANSTFWTGQLGAANDNSAYRVPGTVEANSAGEQYILGEDYEWYPLTGEDESRMLPMYGEALVAPGPLGGALVEPGPLGGSDLDSIYRNSMLRR